MNSKNIATIVLASTVLLTVGCRNEMVKPVRDAPSYSQKLRTTTASDVISSIKSRRHNYKFVQADDWAGKFYKSLRMGVYN
jgi:hypothetical protein